MHQTEYIKISVMMEGERKNLQAVLKTITEAHYNLSDLNSDIRISIDTLIGNIQNGTLLKMSSRPQTPSPINGMGIHAILD
jgi:hypothetical protein